MIFKLWHKLALTIIGITSVILILALLLSQQSVKSGFLDYLNNVEEKRHKSLAGRLIRQYEFNDNWDFIKGNKRIWNRYLHESRPNDPRGNKPSRGGHQRPRLPPPHFKNFARRFEAPEGYPPPRREASIENTDRHPDFKRNRRPPKRPKPPPVNISLLDQHHKIVIGFTGHNQNAINKPLMLNGVVIGYLRIKPFTEIIGELDQRFIDHQQQAFIKIALIALVLTMIGAWMLALYLRRRIDQIGTYARQLMEGQYSKKIEHSSLDELGQLADHLNYLGKTLSENRYSRQQWIADISHELRTPLAILHGQVEALEDGIRPFDRNAIKLLGGEINRLGKLVEDLYQLSLSDLGALAYHKEILNLPDLIEGTIAHFQERLATKQLDLQMSLTTCSNLNMLGDSQRLRQLFINLLENSIRYTDLGGCIKISCYQQRRSILLCLEDSTPSVPLDQLDRLFRRLYRGESSRNRKTGGAGLGLAIVHAIVEAHEGRIIAKPSSLGGLLLELKFPIIPKT